MGASAIYQERNTKSETNKFAALGKQVTPDSSENRDLHHLEISLSPPISSSTRSPPQSNKYSLTQAPSSTDFSFTQEAISGVQKDIQELKGSFTPSMPSHHQVVVKMGEEVRELKKEIGIFT